MSIVARRARVAILISGRGSNMASLIEAAAAPDYPAEIVLVVSNRADAAGLDKARTAGFPTAIVPHEAHRDRASFDGALMRELTSHAVEIVCLAGFMRILGDDFVEAWRGRMINIHPSLLPAFKGLRPHAQALAAGVAVHGCTVHFVVPQLDSGPPIAQARVPVLPGDTEASLAQRVLAEEHRLYPKALAAVARGDAQLRDGRTAFASARP